jgi:hypothetical protein
MTSTLSKAAMVGAFVLCCGTPFAHATTNQKLSRMSCDMPEPTDVAGSRSTETLAFANAMWGASVAPLTQRPSLHLRGGDAQNRQSPRSPPRSCESFSSFDLGVEKIFAYDFGTESKNGGIKSSDDLLSLDGVNRARRYKLSRTVEN